MAFSQINSTFIWTRECPEGREERFLSIAFFLQKAAMFTLAQQPSLSTLSTAVSKICSLLNGSTQQFNTSESEWKVKHRSSKIKVETKRRHNNGQGCLDCLLDDVKIGLSFLKHQNPVESVEYTELFLVGNKGIIALQSVTEECCGF